MKFNFMKSKTSIIFIVVLIIILGASVFFIARQYVKSNADYICSKTTYGDCSIDNTQTQNSFSCVDGKYQRVIKGIRAIAGIEFNWRRSTCPLGYTQASYSSSRGNSGLIGSERVNVSYSSCSFVEYGNSCETTNPSCTPTASEYINDKGECVAKLPTDLCINITDGKSHDEKYIKDNNLIHNPVENKCNIEEDLCVNQPGISTTTFGYVRVDTLNKLCFTEAVEQQDAAIKLGINCSTNNGNTWNDCSKVILASKNQPIKLKAIINGTENEVGRYEWYDTETKPQPVAYFDKINPSELSKLPQPIVNLLFGAGNKFTKDIGLKFTTKDGKYNLLVKRIEITISAPDTFKEI